MLATVVYAFVLDSQSQATNRVNTLVTLYTT